MKEILHRQIQVLNPHYAFCGEKKTIDHAFFSYPHAVSIWINSPLRLRSSLLISSNIVEKWKEVCDILHQNHEGEGLVQLFGLFYCIFWKDRNEMVFGNSPKSYFEMITLYSDLSMKNSELPNKIYSPSILRLLLPLKAVTLYQLGVPLL